MKLFFTTILFILLGLGVNAQNYTRDAGFRFGGGFSLNYRQFTKENVAMELFVGYQERGLRIGGLKQQFTPAFERYSENFKLYYGYGVHTGFTYTNKHKLFNREYKYDWTFSPVFGMDGIVGLEYYFHEVPILVSADIRPYFEFSINRFFHVKPFNMSLSVKYRF
jgi:hypothetical protein